MADFNARVVLSAKNSASAPIRQLRNDLRGLTDSFRGLGRTTGLRDLQRDFVGLGRTVSDIHRRHIAPMAASLGKISGFTFGAALGASAVGFVRTMNSAADAIDKVSKASRKIDMDPNKLRAFAHVADLAGVSFEAVETGMKGAAKAFIETQNAHGKANNRLKEFAPILRNQMAGARDTAEAASYALSAMHDAIEQGDESLAQLISQTVFGSTDWMAIGEQTGEEIRSGIESAMKLLGSMKPQDFLNVEAYNDSLTDMIASFKGTRDQIAAEILPELTPIIKQWTETFTAGRGEFVKSVVEPVKEAITWLKQVDWATVGTAFREIGAGISSALRDIKDNLSGIVELIRILNDPQGYGQELGRKARQKVGEALAPGDPMADGRDAPLNNLLDGIPRRARGGPLSAGQLAIVGEEGPELFRPNAAGNVFTASQTRAMMRQQTGGGTLTGLTRALNPLTDAIEDLTEALKPIKLASLGGSGFGGPGGAGASFSAVRDAVRSGSIALPGGAGASAGGPGGAAGRTPGKGFFEAIIAAEGTAVKGDPYEEVLGYGAYGRPDKPLTGMTLNEVKEFGLSMRRAQAARGKPWNRTSSASGAFQITGTTMMESARRLGMDPAATMFDQDTQRRMAVEIANRQGLGAWEGFKHHPGQRRAAAAALAAGVDPSGAARQSVGRVRPNIAGIGTPLAFTGRYRQGVDERLTKVLEQAALEFPDYRVEAFSGHRPGDRRFHGKGMATDVALFDRKTGQKLANYQDDSTFEAYEKFAQKAREVQQRMYPELDKSLRWGGYFSGGPGKYGAMDPMHFDLGGNRVGMAGGSWDNGLTKEQRRLWPRAQSTGMAALTNRGRNRSQFTPATREQGYRAAEVPAQKVEVGKGALDIRLSLPDGVGVSNIGVKQPENLTANVGVDRTGAFRPPSGTKTGMRGPG